MRSPRLDPQYGGEGEGGIGQGRREGDRTGKKALVTKGLRTATLLLI